jgi:hypothetical protein
MPVTHSIAAIRFFQSRNFSHGSPDGGGAAGHKNDSSAAFFVQPIGSQPASADPPTGIPPESSFGQQSALRYHTLILTGETRCRVVQIEMTLSGD